MPTLSIKSPAEKDIRDLATEIRARITSAILALRETPFPHGVHKLIVAIVSALVITESSTNLTPRQESSPSTASSIAVKPIGDAILLIIATVPPLDAPEGVVFSTLPLRGCRGA